MRTLTVSDLYDILNGATILACGGGGPYALGEQLINYIATLPNPTVQLADPTYDVSNSAMLGVSISIGAADAPLGKDPVASAVAGFDALSQQIGAPLNYVLPGETGAVNTLYAMALGAYKGIPVIDADGGRRSIPELQMSSLALAPISPVVLTGNNNLMTLLTQSAAQTDSAVRGLGSVDLFGEDASAALWSMNGQLMKQVAVLNSVSYTQSLGITLRNALSSGQDPVNAVMNYMGAKSIFKGYITDVQESASGGFDMGFIRLEWTMGRRVWIYGQNENMIAWANTETTSLGMSPDLLCFLTEDGIPFTTGDLYRAKDKIVALFGAPCVPQLRQGGILEAYIQALIQMGYAGPYIPIEYAGVPGAVKETAATKRRTNGKKKDQEVVAVAEKPTKGRKKKS